MHVRDETVRTFHFLILVTKVITVVVVVVVVVVIIIISALLKCAENVKK